MLAPWDARFHIDSHGLGVDLGWRACGKGEGGGPVTVLPNVERLAALDLRSTSSMHSPCPPSFAAIGAVEVGQLFISPFMLTS